MNNFISVDSSWARNNFFDVLEGVYSESKSYLIKKSGITVAMIVKPKFFNKKLMDFAGAWSDFETKELLENVASGRKDRGKLKRKLPHVFD